MLVQQMPLHTDSSPASRLALHLSWWILLKHRVQAYRWVCSNCMASCALWGCTKKELLSQSQRARTLLYSLGILSSTLVFGQLGVHFYIQHEPSLLFWRWTGHCWRRFVGEAILSPLYNSGSLVPSQWHHVWLYFWTFNSTVICPTSHLLLHSICIHYFNYLPLSKRLLWVVISYQAPPLLFFFFFKSQWKLKHKKPPSNAAGSLRSSFSSYCGQPHCEQTWGTF